MIAFVTLVALQSAAGAMISVRSAGAACGTGCGAQWPPGTARLWHPLQPGSADELEHGPRAGEALHTLHRLGAVVLTVAAALLAATMVAGTGAAYTRRALVVFAVCAVLGLLVNVSAGSLSLAVAHALAAGVLVASLAAALGGAAAGRQRP
jgi:heme A synthase